MLFINIVITSVAVVIIGVAGWIVTVGIRELLRADI